MSVQASFAFHLSGTFSRNYLIWRRVLHRPQKGVTSGPQRANSHRRAPVLVTLMRAKSKHREPASEMSVSPLPFTSLTTVAIPVLPIRGSRDKDCTHPPKAKVFWNNYVISPTKCLYHIMMITIFGPWLMIKWWLLGFPAEERAYETEKESLMAKSWHPEKLRMLWRDKNWWGKGITENRHLLTAFFETTKWWITTEN